jgi:hypothetical protein
MARRYATPEGREQLKANAAKWRKSDTGKEAISSAGKARRASDPVASMLKSIKSRASKEGIQFELELEWTRELLAPMLCSVTGIQLTWKWDGPGKNPWAPSLDRLTPSEGYTFSNVRLVCWAYNLARSNWPDAVVRKMAEGLLR